MSQSSLFAFDIRQPAEDQRPPPHIFLVSDDAVLRARRRGLHHQADTVVALLTATPQGAKITSTAQFPTVASMPLDVMKPATFEEDVEVAWTAKLALSKGGK